MDMESTELRNALPLNPEPLFRPLRYTAGTACVFSVEESSLAGTAASRSITLGMRPVRDRLLATFSSQGSVATALIGVDGRLYDFNGRIFAGASANADTFRQVAEGMRRNNPAITSVLNDFAIFLPWFQAAPYTAGSTVAVIRGDQNELWASFVYRGTTEVKGRQGALLDIVRGGPAAADQVALGFTVIDRQLGIPLLLVMQSGATVRAELTSCA